MHSLYLGLGLLSLGLVNAWTFPECEPDSCYRNLVDTRFVAEANTFCPKFLSGTTTAASAIPTDFNNCGGVSDVSSACSCITYSLTSSSSSSKATSTPAPVTSASTTPSSTPAKTSSSSPVMTTSTIYTTSIYTVTSCASSVTNCPAKIGQLTTETIVISTTVCPVAESTIPAPPPVTVSSVKAVSSTPSIITSSVIAPKTSVGTVSSTPKPTTTGLQVTSAAGRVSSGFNMVAVAAGVMALIFLV